MANVYMLNNDGSTEAMNGIHCMNEDLELQRILELNPDLIPGEQINPYNPRRWLVVKREMPVPDPGTGNNRWSIDLFFLDQDAMPTFIECKRYNDTRAKREVVGQMLEYAANGHHYWSKDEMREYAQEAAENSGLSLEEQLKSLQPEETDSVDTFFQRAQDNLREGQIRLVFFMEEAPQELKSVVDFLNKQMERSEVLLVEARQYEHNGIKIVAPILFGFTEEARQVKRTVSVTSTQRRKWDKDSFFIDAREQLGEKDVQSIKAFFDKSQELKGEFSWGTGKINGSFSVKWPHIGNNSVFTVFSDGVIAVNYGSFNKNQEQKEFIVLLKEELANRLNFSVPEDYERRYPSYSINDWSPKIDQLLVVLEWMIDKYPVPESI